MEKTKLLIIDLVISVIILAIEIAASVVFHCGWLEVLFFLPSVIYEVICVVIFKKIICKIL